MIMQINTNEKKKMEEWDEGRWEEKEKKKENEEDIEGEEEEDCHSCSEMYIVDSALQVS